MIVVFNKKGITKEQLDSYGNLPRVGSQAFQIFAYFDGVDISNYGSAYIKLYRPDYSGSAYPILFMTLGDLTFDSSKGVASNYLQAGQTYRGFLFDFSKVRDTKGTVSLDDDTVVTLLDTPGQWRAVITLVSKTKISNVVGSVSFNVGGVPTNDDETDVDLDVVISTMADVLAEKLDKESAYYVREISGFEAKAAAGELPASYFTAGSLAFDESNSSFYKLLTVTANESADGYVYCSSYTKISLGDSFLSLTGNSAAHPITGDVYFDNCSLKWGSYGIIDAGYGMTESIDGGIVYLGASGGGYAFGSGNVVEGGEGSYHPTFYLNVHGLITGHRNVNIPGEDGTLATREWCNSNLASNIDIQADLNTPYTYIFNLKNASGQTIDSASITLASEEVTADLEAYVDNAASSALTTAENYADGLVSGLTSNIQNGTIKAGKTSFSDEFSTYSNELAADVKTIHVCAFEADRPNTIFDFGLVSTPSGFGSVYKNCINESGTQYLLIRDAVMFNKTTLTLKRRVEGSSSFETVSGATIKYKAVY